MQLILRGFFIKNNKLIEEKLIKRRFSKMENYKEYFLFKKKKKIDYLHAHKHHFFFDIILECIVDGKDKSVFIESKSFLRVFEVVALEFRVLNLVQEPIQKLVMERLVGMG